MYRKKIITEMIILCAFCSSILAHQISIVNWNVQTFFDAVTEGSEYSDFKKKALWNSENYSERIRRLTDSLKSMDADIFVLEEIENLAVVQDLANNLEDHSWNSNRNWKHAVFAKNPGDSIGCAVLSRFPLKNVQIHNLDIRTEDSYQPSMRPLIQVEVQTDKNAFILLVNHWKSKSGGGEKSEIWRDWQESLLAELFRNNLDKGKAVVASGDFNRDISEFSMGINSDKNILLSETVPVHSPWINYSGSLVSPGSYWFNENWERIDHFFCAGPVTIKNFSPLTDGPWFESQKPNRYVIFTGKGYSDHLPIGCRLIFE